MLRLGEVEVAAMDAVDYRGGPALASVVAEGNARKGDSGGRSFF